MNLFPAGLESSLFPAILVGVLITFVATETLGWSFTGLIVPGYLGSVALVAPRAAVLMSLEALLTFAVVRALSDGAERIGVGSRFFGRERFFLTLVVATGLRLLVEHALLPPLADLTGDLGRLALGTGDVSAHSIGLVLVPLMAHTLDKVGLRGSIQLACLTSLAALVVWGLTRTTDLSLADLSVTFEDVAFSIDRSPKAYVVLLTGALLAARANVAFGWDFHGIIVPGLLAVAWFTPHKILGTLVEVALVLMLAKTALRLPWLRTAQIEGPRRLVLVFCCDAVLRFVLVAVAGGSVPWLSSSDLYGFGYLLPALLAVKIWQRGSMFRVLLPATQVSVGGFVLGNALVLLFSGVSLLLARPASAGASDAKGDPIPWERATLLGRAYVARDGEATLLSANELDAWRGGLARLADGGVPAEAFSTLDRLGVLVRAVADDPGSVLVHEAGDDLGGLRGLGVIVARRSAARLAVGVPRPGDADIVLAAGEVTRLLDARALVISGRPDASNEPLAGSRIARSTWGAARRAFGPRGWLEIVADRKADPGGELWLPPGRTDAGPEVDALRQLLPDLTVSRHPGVDVPTVAAPEDTWRRLVGTPCEPLAASASALAPRDLLAPPRPGGNRELEAWTPAEKLLYDEAIVRPLLQRAPLGLGVEGTSVCRVAGALGLGVSTIVDAAGARHAVVQPIERAAATTFVRIGPGPGEDRLVGVPYPGGSMTLRRAGAALYDALGARALIVAAGHAPGAVDTYDAAGEAFALASTRGVLALEVRGQGDGEPRLGQGAVLSWGGMAGTPPSEPSWLDPLDDALVRVGIDARRHDGTSDVVCCGDFRHGLRARLARLDRGHLATLHLSQELRDRRFQDGDVDALQARARSAGIQTVRGRLVHALGDLVDAATAARKDEPSARFSLARRFAGRRHIADLHALAGEPGVRLVSDPVTGERFLIFATRRSDGSVAAGVVNVRDPGPDGARKAGVLRLPAGAQPDPDTLDRLARGGWMAMFAEGLPATRRTP